MKEPRRTIAELQKFITLNNFPDDASVFLCYGDIEGVMVQVGDTVKLFRVEAQSILSKSDEGNSVQ